jgi:hypothetical protein
MVLNPLFCLDLRRVKSLSSGRCACGVTLRMEMTTMMMMMMMVRPEEGT